MPELPDICAYLDALECRIGGQELERVSLLNPFFLRSAAPPLDEIIGQTVTNFQRLGKRVVIGMTNDYWLVIHLMVAGRFQWSDGDSRTKKPTRNTLALFHFAAGTLVVTEAGTKKRASLHLVHGREALQQHDPGGLEVLTTDLLTFAERIRRENHTLKRALTDPRILSGIGNAYSDEILHAARLSPVRLSSRLDDEAMRRLFAATQDTLQKWLDRLSVEAKQEFPTKVTAFRPDMAVHAATTNHARIAARPFNEFVTPVPKPTIARRARPAADCWPIVRCQGCSRRIGPKRSMNSSARRRQRDVSPNFRLNERITGNCSFQGDASARSGSTGQAAPANPGGI